MRRPLAIKDEKESLWSRMRGIPGLEDVAKLLF